MYLMDIFSSYSVHYPKTKLELVYRILHQTGVRNFSQGKNTVQKTRKRHNPRPPALQMLYIDNHITSGTLLSLTPKLVFLEDVNCISEHLKDIF